ncbi:Mlr5572 protein [Nonlabens ulvanivorans]|nr:DUF4260 domain-containing protein [Nonlabens ulvanivorans]GAK91940.1 Mlr5572 protein [Nonlabens ulvanivorans]
MKWLLKLEGLGILMVGLYGFYYTDYSWWIFAALLLTPDIGALGYLINNRLGAMTYNFFHHLLVAIAVLAIGKFLKSDITFMYGWIMIAHIGMDRIFGYGLKYPDAFKSTHLDKL